MSKFNNFIVRTVIKNSYNVEGGSFKLLMPDKTFFFIGSKKHKNILLINIYSYKTFYRFFFNGMLGIGESYIKKEWDTPELVRVIELAATNRNFFKTKSKIGILSSFINKIFFYSSNTKSGSKKNISYHYDLGNEFFSIWLDKTMTYSSGYFAQKNNSLEKAQYQKYAMLSKSLSINKTDKVLEIGCGWGGFLEYASKKTACKITGITISKEQYNYTNNRIKTNFINKNANVKLCDYRNLSSKYDKVISIEMFEAVGEEYWDKYFKILSSILKNKGKAALQIITIDEDLYKNYSKNIDFIQRYIFPGGMLPSKNIIFNKAIKNGFNITETATLGNDYALTLSKWKSNFLNKWNDIEKLGFDKRFKLIWEYYLSYCEAGFRHGSINVRQFILNKSK